MRIRSIGNIIVFILLLFEKKHHFKLRNSNSTDRRFVYEFCLL